MYEPFFCEGLCEITSKGFIVRNKTGVISLSSGLEERIGGTFSFFIHHHPPEIKEDLWGMGSCTWNPQPCPCGHHFNPRLMLKWQGKGKLQKSSSFYSFEDSGKVEEWPVMALDKHYIRAILTPVLDPLEEDVSSVGKKGDSLLKEVLKIQSIIKSLKKKG